MRRKAEVEDMSELAEQIAMVLLARGLLATDRNVAAVARELQERAK